MTIPILPESAPFTPAQRAWLNGFFAGLLGLGADGNGNGSGVANGMALAGASVAVNGTATGAATAVAVAEVEAEEEFPWHDPALPMDERLRLADDRPLPRKLMAASRLPSMMMRSVLNPASMSNPLV